LNRNQCNDFLFNNSKNYNIYKNKENINYKYNYNGKSSINANVNIISKDSSSSHLNDKILLKKKIYFNLFILKIKRQKTKYKKNMK